MTTNPCGRLKSDALLWLQAVPPMPPPVTKSLWSSASESVLEYCRVVWDIFPPDTDDQKLIRFVVSDAKQQTRVLNKWDEQSSVQVSAGLAGIGRPEPEARRPMAEAKGYDISKGIEVRRRKGTVHSHLEQR